MRTEQTESEKRIWYYLRDRRFFRLKFKRQVVLGNYIVDFVCFSKKLIIEIDGSQHASQEKYDEQRTQWLNSQGYRVLRFWNMDVLASTELVFEVIRRECFPSVQPGT